MNKINNQKILFSWNLTFECNYRCPYCWFDSNWAKLKTKSHRPVRELVKYWDNIQKKYGSVHIDVLGGEPFLFPNFAELVKEISDLHSLGITTNLSCDISVLVKNTSPAKVGIRPSFHPLFAKFDDFLKKALLLKENGFCFEVTYVAYPPQIKQIAYYKSRFEKEGLSFSIFIFWGKYNGVYYPAGYTDEEKKLIEPYIGERCGEKFQIIPKKVKGLLCHAGHKNAVIHENGNVIRCGGANSDELIGNFFDEDFKLLDGPQLCNY